MQSWHLRESLQNALHGLSKYVTQIPTADGDRHFVVVTLVQRNRHTNIEFDVQQLEGGVRATGLLCLFGVGICLGSVIIYRLYTTLFPWRGIPKSVTPRVRRPSSANIHGATNCDDSLAETPDSGIATDELTALLKHRQLRKLRRSCSDCGIAARRATGWNQISELFDEEDEFTVVSLPILKGCKRSAVVEDWLARTDCSRSEGYLEDQDPRFACPETDCKSSRTTNCHPSCRSSGFMSAGLGAAGYTSADFTGSEQDDRLNGFFTAGGVMHRVGRTAFITRADGASGGSVDLSLAGSLIDAELRRRGIGGRTRRLSFSSETGASEYTYHESLVSKGYSVDLGEDLAGMFTPPECDEGLQTAGLQCWTETSMERLHEELRNIQKDIDDMNERVGGLQSRDTIFYAIVPSGDFSPSGSSPSDHHHADLIRFSPLDFSMEKLSAGSDFSIGRARSSSPFSHCGSDGDFNVAMMSGVSGGCDFMWDYQSDLALELSDKPSFVAARPYIAEKFRQSEERSSCGDAEMDLDYTRGSTGTNHCGDDGVTAADLYIDDDLITLEIHNSPAEEEDCKQRGTALDNDDAFVSGGDLMDWFDDEEMWGSAAATVTPRDTKHKKLHTDRSKERHERARKLRKSSAGSLHEILSVRRDSKSRGSSGTSSISRRRDSHTSVAAAAAATAAAAGDAKKSHKRSQDVNSMVVTHGAEMRSGGSRPCSGRSLLDGSQYTPPLGSRPPTGVSTPVATVKPITEQNVTNALAVSCCHGNVPTYNLVSEGMARASVGWVVENIGRRVDAQKRVESNDFPQTTKQGYRQILRLWKRSCVRPVRADMYSSLRAVLFQAMLKQLPILSGAKTLDYCYQQLSQYIACTHRYMNEWNFANRLPFAKGSVQMKLAECLHALFEQVAAVSLMPSEACREDYLVALFNHNPDTDLRLLEAVKVLMMLRAVSLYEDFTSGRAVASYVWQLFTRDSSRSIEQLFMNHINSIGDTTRLSQAELSLLGHTLGLRIQVARPYCTEVDEMLVTHPDEGADRYDTVQIIEESPAAAGGCYCMLSS